MSNSGTAQVLIPRSLCLIEDIDNLIIDVEDLCSVYISWENGFVSELKPLKNKYNYEKLPLGCKIYKCEAGVAKWLRQRLVAPLFGGSNPLARPQKIAP